MLERFIRFTRRPQRAALLFNAVVLVVLAGCSGSAEISAPAAADVSITPIAVTTPSAIPIAVVPVTPTPLPDPTATQVPEPTATPIATEPTWALNGFVNALESTASGRFGVDGAPDSLGSIFAGGDEATASVITQCFDADVRAALGDEFVDSYDPIEATDQPVRATAHGAAIDALFACVPAEQIRNRAISREAVGWNWYIKPDPFQEVAYDDPCLQQLYPADLDEFRVVWSEADGAADLRRGSCIPDNHYRQLVELPAVEAEPTDTGTSLAGRRGLTLQWISWEPQDWGAIEFVPLGDERYQVAGRQDGPDGDLVWMKGTATRISDTELRFDGWLVTRVGFLNGGDLCTRHGEMQFLATEGRQFWRMRDFMNCDNATTDYVDIYFG